MIAGLVELALGALGEVLAWLGLDKLAERVEGKQRADRRNWTPPR